MKTHHLIQMSLVAFGVALSASALADNMSKAEYRAAKDRIAADAKMDKEKCKSLAGNAKDVCMEQAKGHEKVAYADLDAQNNPSIKTQYDARMARADADYAVAKERCDDLAGNAKDVCVKEAKANHTSAQADAKTQEKVADAHKDADSQKTDAAYAVAKEKCDAYAGDAKNSCISDAKMRFGK